MKIKNCKNLGAVITLVGTLLVTSLIDFIVLKATEPYKSQNEDSSEKIYANQHDGNVLNEKLLSAASSVVKSDPSHSTASVDELISIGFKEDKLYFSCVASDNITNIVRIELDSASNDIDSTLKFIAETNYSVESKFTLNATYYVQENMNSDMTDSLEVKYNLSSVNNRYAYGVDNSPLKNGNLFVTYASSDELISVSNASFNASNEIDETSAIINTASRHNNSYLYWLLYTMCA